MALINLDLQYHIILTVKVLGGFWAGFCDLLGWKSSIQSGNTAHTRQDGTTTALRAACCCFVFCSCQYIY